MGSYVSAREVKGGGVRGGGGPNICDCSIHTVFFKFGKKWQTIMTEGKLYTLKKGTIHAIVKLISPKQS